MNFLEKASKIKITINNNNK